MQFYFVKKLAIILKLCYNYFDLFYYIFIARSRFTMNSFVEVFDKVLDYFQTKVNKGELTDVAFNLWIKTLKPLNLDENVAYFNVQSEFQKGIILKNYSNMLSDAFINVLGFPVDIEIIPKEDTPAR